MVRIGNSASRTSSSSTSASLSSEDSSSAGGGEIARCLGREIRTSDGESGSVSTSSAFSCIKGDIGEERGAFSTCLCVVDFLAGGGDVLASFVKSGFCPYEA